MPFPRFKLVPDWIDIDVRGWELTGIKETGESIVECHTQFHPYDENVDIENAMDWAEGIIGSRQEWLHLRERGFDRWEAGTLD
ncbi:hypothetical protein ACH427_16875 [Streptomyces sp. NPDC020379]|uniref:hypothetical protein n=1 Tax=Streptomyces sp. NPDC020379 TaxID=3365071 RepID=UPI0037AD2F2D